MLRRHNRCWRRRLRKAFDWQGRYLLWCWTAHYQSVGELTAHYQSVGRLLHISHHSSNCDPGNPQMLQLSATLAWIRVHTHLGQMQETHFGRFVCKPILAHQEELGSRLSAYPSETSCSQRLKTRDCSVIFSYINATIWHFAYVSLSLLVEESCFRKETPDL